MENVLKEKSEEQGVLQIKGRYRDMPELRVLSRLTRTMHDGDDPAQHGLCMSSLDHDMGPFDYASICALSR